MHLFVIGWRPAGHIDADVGATVQALAARIPPLRGSVAGEWRSPTGRVVVASVAHRPEQLGGVRYVDADGDGMALFAGRPIRWTGPAAADGRTVLDPGAYRSAAERWAPALDGRFCAARYSSADDVLEVVTDPMDSYPLYATEHGGTRWFSNNALLLRDLTGQTAESPDALAAFLGCGWSFGGQPAWTAIRRLARGRIHRVGSRTDQTELLPTATIASWFDRGLDVEAAAARLVAATAALGDWPGRPLVVPLTGGRDSRVVFAAALRSGSKRPRTPRRSRGWRAIPRRPTSASPGT
jgi:hypothetical protein